MLYSTKIVSFENLPSDLLYKTFSFLTSREKCTLLAANFFFNKEVKLYWEKFCVKKPLEVVNEKAHFCSRSLIRNFISLAFEDKPQKISDRNLISKANDQQVLVILTLCEKQLQVLKSCILAASFFGYSKLPNNLKKSYPLLSSSQYVQMAQLLENFKKERDQAVEHVKEERAHPKCAKRLRLVH